ncbi:MAG: PqqD family protein [Aridibacter sp.]
MNPLARNKNLVVQQADNELLVYDLNINKAICLNETSALIWQNCDGEKNMLEIAKVVEKKFGELVSEDFVKIAIDQLKKENLIENKNEVVTEFVGMSRRDVIKRIGFTSLVALPLVASLTAPPASAQSSACIADGETTSSMDPNAQKCCNQARNRCCSTRLVDVNACVTNFDLTNNSCTAVCAVA